MFFTLTVHDYFFTGNNAPIFEYRAPSPFSESVLDLVDD